MSEQRSILGKLGRMAGQSPEKREEVRRINADYAWRVKCWYCGKYHEGKLDDLKTCKFCGHNLWSRDEESLE